MARDRFAYLHLPKAAGTSVVAALRESFDEASWCPYESDRVLFGAFDDFDELSDFRRSKIFLDEPSAMKQWDVVTGHFSYPTLVGGFAPSEIAMVLREPRCRLMSHYTFWRTRPPEGMRSWGTYDHSRVGAAHTWEGFLGDPHIASHTDNLALRMLLRGDRSIPPSDFIATADVAALVDAALDVIGQLGHVDVVETGSDTWQALASWLDVDLAVERRNTTPTRWAPLVGRSALTSQARSLLAERTAGDRMLWRYLAERRGLDVAAVERAAWESQLTKVTARHYPVRSSARKARRRVVRSVGSRLRHPALRSIRARLRR